MQSFVPARLTPRQRGDFQTPLDLARQVWATIAAERYDLVVEPTFGLGNFLRTLPADCRAEVVGWEIDPDSCAVAKAACPGHFRLHCRDLFAVRQRDLGAGADARLLVIGNPPWVTNAEQGTLGGENTGAKWNRKALAGLDALTGKANFDIAEAIILHLITLTRPYRATDFALLVKATVARNLLTFLGEEPWIGDFGFHRIDARQHFGASADAGLLKFRVGPGIARRRSCPVFDGIAGPEIGEIGLVGRRLVHDAAVYRRTAGLEAPGVAHYQWRQGIKHDLRDLFELTEDERGLRNRRGEPVRVEPEVLHSLYKGSDIYHDRPARFVVPIYQRDLQDQLDTVPARLPHLWRYLDDHRADFAARKSRIYRGRPPFALFGVGDYTYRRFKVAIGALYDEPRFRLLAPDPRLPVTDDTCYFIATDDQAEAVYLWAILGLDLVRDFLLAISAAGEKRRFTKEVLSRLLLPPASACPPALRRTIEAERRDRWGIAPATARELEAWLLDYRQPVGQLSLFEPIPQ